MLDIIKELKSKEDCYRSYVKIEVLTLLSKIIDSTTAKKTTKIKLSVIKSEIELIWFDYRSLHLGNQKSHDLINTCLKMALSVINENQ